MIRLILIAILLVATLPTGVSVAANTANPAAEKQAKKSFQSAEAHFKAGRFAEALVEYQEGYALYPLPGFLINIAQCQRRLGELENARATYRKFVMVAPDSPFVPEVKNLVAELDTLLADLDASKKNEAKLEPKPVQAAPVVPSNSSVATAPVPPPSPTSRTDLAVAPEAPAPATAPGPRWWLWGTVGVVAAAAATTAVILLRSPETVTLHDGSAGTLRR